MKNILKSSGLITVFMIILSAFTYGQSSPFSNEPEFILDDWASVLLWVDLDNDGMKDVIVCGYKKDCYNDINGNTFCFESAYSLYVYRNKGNSQFELLDTIALAAINYPVIQAADFNNNGFMDIIISGDKIVIYKNHGNWYLEEMQLENVPGLNSGNISFVDFNNDGLMDFLISGQNKAGEVSSILSMNRGDFEFTPIPTDIIGVSSGKAAWLDIDRDGYADLLITGGHVTERRDLIPFTGIYRNNGDGTFTHLDEIPVRKIRSGTARWGDYNNDGNINFLIAAFVSKVDFYQKNDATVFNSINSETVSSLYASLLLWEDFDNDGDLDIFSIGNEWENVDGKDSLMHKTFYYDFDGNYQPLDLNLPELFLGYSSSSVADIDNSGTLDIIISGLTLPSAQKTTYVLKNNSQPNTPPTIPTNLTSQVNENKVYLNWDISSDDQTHPESLMYSIRIGTSSGSTDIMSPASILATGERLKYEQGNIRKTIEGYPVNNLKPGIYYWSVQAVDAGYMSSAFAEEQTFTIEHEILSPARPIRLSAKSISENIVKLEWVYPFADNAEFIIERSYADSLNFQVVDIVNNKLYSYTDKNLIPDTGYLYRIKTLLNDVESEYSDTVSVKTRLKTYFSKVYDSPLTKDKFITTGAAWGDVNNNGLPDLCVINSSAPIQVFINLDNGEFREMTLEQKKVESEWFLSPYGNNKSVSWVDIDNDGFLDLFITQGYPYPNLIFQNNGDETFTQITNSEITINMGETLAAAWADFDNDGLLDVLVCGWEHKVLLFRNLGDFKFEKVDFNFHGNMNVDCSGCNWVDFNDDGLSDVFVANYFMRNFLYKNNGDGTFEKITTGAIVTDFEPSVSGAWADYDNDGLIDLLVLNNVNQDNSFYKNMGDGTFTKPSALPFANNTGILGAGNMGAWEDINNNGNLDLFIAHGYNNRFYINEGDGLFTELTGEPFCTDYGSSFAVIWADFNNNGFLDLFIANNGNQENFFYINNGLGYTADSDTTSERNNRINIRLKGKNSNSFGVGAKLVVETDKMTLTRYIATQSGAINNTNGLMASVGIGPNENARATITWPTGYVQEVHSLKSNQLHVIEEPEESVLPTSVINRKKPSKLMFSLYPNPVNATLNIRISDNHDGKRISITDISGIMMRQISLNGDNSLVIDVSDLKSGIYFVVVESEKGKSVKRFSKVR